jgi:hypothetical protein
MTDSRKIEKRLIGVWRNIDIDDEILVYVSNVAMKGSNLVCYVHTLRGTFSTSTIVDAVTVWVSVLPVRMGAQFRCGLWAWDYEENTRRGAGALWQYAENGEVISRIGSFGVILKAGLFENIELRGGDYYE